MLQKLSLKEQEEVAEPLRTADTVLSQVAAAVPLDVMPGRHDPSNYTLPQQKMHGCLFPHASRYSTFNPVTNPYEATIGGVR